MALWERVSGIFRRAPAPSVEVVTGDIVQEQALWLQFQRIGGSITPQQVSAIICEADTGRIARLVDLANEARQKDGHLHAVLQTRELAVKGLAWSLAAHDDASEAEKTAAADCQAALRGSDNFPELVAHLTGASFHGHATAETMNRLDAGKIVPERWKLMSPRRFVFSQAAGKLLWSDDGVDVAGQAVLEVYPGKFVQYQPRVNGDVPAREGLARLLLWAALFRNWTLRDWLQLGEIGWKPQRLGFYRKDADKKDVEALKRAISKLVATGAATLPETTKLETTYPTNGQRSSGSSSHKELFDAMGAEMGKAVLGQNSTTEAGPNGSRASDQVRNEVRSDILISDAIGIASVLTRHFVRPFYALNYGPGIRPANFVFHTEDNVDLETFAAAVKSFAEAGVKVPQAWIRRQGSIPDPKDGEDVIGEAPAADPSGADSKPAKAAA